MGSPDATSTNGLPKRIEVIRGTLACTREERGRIDIIPDGLMTVDERGTIVSVEAAPTACEVPETRPGAVWLPGFVDTHVHYPQTRVMGRATGPLLDWLQQTIFPEESRFVDEAYAQAVADEFCGALARFGTTTAAVYGSSHAGATDVLFDTFARRGLRGLLGMTLMDRDAPEALLMSADLALAAAEELVQKWHGHDAGRLRYCVTPRFALSCTTPLMKGAAALAQKYDLWVQTHVAENTAEMAAVAAQFPDAHDYLAVYADHGLIGAKTVLAHCIWFDDDIWNRVATAGCSVSHCPDSNFFLGSGQMVLDAPTQRGIHVGLGTDVGAGRSFSLRRMAASAYDTALITGSSASAEALIWLATAGGAAALGLGDTIGALRPGYEADVIAIDLPPHSPRDGEGLWETLAFQQDAGPVTACYVRGQKVSAAVR